MKIDLNKLAEHFARTPFCVEAVYNCTLEPGAEYAGLTQPFPGFLFSLQGKGELIFDGTPYILSQETIVHGGARMDMVYRGLEGAQWEYLLVLYRIAGQEPAGISLNDFHFEVQARKSPRQAELLGQLYQASGLPGGLNAFRTETLFRCLLDEMFTTAQKQPGDDARKLFDRITADIQEHYMEPLSVGGLAAQHHVNENRLSYVFHKYAGMGPGDYLIAYRLNRAKELMLNVSAPIYAVAKSVGYADPYHFSRIFKKQVGLSPSEFREKFKNNP